MPDWSTSVVSIFSVSGLLIVVAVLTPRKVIAVDWSRMLPACVRVWTVIPLVMPAVVLGLRISARVKLRAVPAGCWATR